MPFSPFVGEEVEATRQSIIGLEPPRRYPGHWPSLLTLGLMPRWLLDQSARENNELPVHLNILECLPPRYCYFL